MFEEMGIDSGLELATVLDAAGAIRDLLQLETTSSAALQGATKSQVLELGRR
jgi:hypothetical protein